jgi:GAF domain-containing protein
MVEELNIPLHHMSKEAKYQMLLSQIQSLLEGERDMIANLSNIASVLKYGLNFFWVGFYIVKDQQLILGPFQGPVACTRIEKGKGVCGKAWLNQKTIIVPDVNSFPGHITCNAASKSEIVVPGISGKKVIFVLDIDSTELNAFDEIDSGYLEKIVSMLIDYSDC